VKLLFVIFQDVPDVPGDVMSALKSLQEEIKKLAAKLDSLPHDLIRLEYQDGEEDITTLANLPFLSMESAEKHFYDVTFRCALYKHFKLHAPRDQRIISYFFKTMFTDELLSDYFWPTQK
jgi:hypothetical protein